MPKAKAPRFSRRKSHKIATVKLRDTNDANITFEEFQTLAKLPTFTKTGSKKNYKVVFKPGDYARFYNVTLEGRDDVLDSEYWVGKIKEIRSADSGSSAWVHVQWLWAPEEVQALNAEIDVSHMGEWERILCDNAFKSETVVHTDTIEGPTEVYFFDEHVMRIPDIDAFYVRSIFNYGKKTLTHFNKESDCSCVQCGQGYNPDRSYETPLRYCATCRVWCHTGCRKGESKRLIESSEFTNGQHYAKGLLLSGPAGDPVRPGPRSKKARNVAERAINVNLKTLSTRVPKRLLNTLVSLAETRIVRPLPGNIVGNKAYVLRAREWVREARTPGGLSRDRVKKLEKWFDELTDEIAVNDLLARDIRREADLTELFVCNECGYPV
ncbi:unnamed protein product [Peniophora sp. CBMAI 1063]|nr:unnamed protein product [Peniophora sp. CBMAI 1063]